MGGREKERDGGGEKERKREKGRSGGGVRERGREGECQEVP